MKNIVIQDVKPFLRWAGGKQWIAQRLARLIPKNIGTYCAPFLGGGSLFFATNPRKAVLGDLNCRLVNTYVVLRDHPEALISILSQWKNEQEVYYEVRGKEFEDRTWQAARLVYLNKTCWNGLYRVNQKGKFNVPYGHHQRDVFNADHLLEVSERMRNTELVCSDFGETVKSAAAGDFVYLDPPYTTLHSGNGFRRYNEKLFTWQDQIRLAEVASDLVARGCLVVVSNADSQEILDLYPSFYYQRVSRHSVLAANSNSRRKTHEALLVSSDELLLDEII